MNFTTILKDLMDIKDYTTFTLKIFDIETDDFVCSFQAYFKLDKLILKGDFEQIQSIYTKQNADGVYKISANDIPSIFSAEFPIRRYDYHELDYIKINRVIVSSNIMMSFGVNIETLSELEILSSTDGSCFDLYNRFGDKQTLKQ